MYARGVEGCPDEADLAEFVRGELSESALTRVEAHLDGCQACAQVVADLVRIFDDSLGASDQGLPTLEGARTERSSDGDEEDEHSGALPSGAEVGRYRVLECIGFGGMGVVYSAYDPQLDRRVALKVLRGSGGGADEPRRNARLLREAKVMAKLSHPNVIVVHDVGSFEGRVFLAMEFVEGTTLSRWMRSTERSWREIRDTFLAAGRGLAAAHDAGLVHRDFKPDNVLIGDDGRVRVTDFGLARDRDESIEQSLQESAWRLEQPGMTAGVTDTFATLTKTGVLVGTPAYMAPEQYGGRGVSGATDQFSFCVALYEALYGERPFPGRTLAELATNVCLGKRKPLGDARVPSRVRDAVLRGLSVEPDARFGSMEELLTILGRRPTRTLRRWTMVAVPSVIAAVSLWWDATPAEAGPSLCRDDGGLADSWNRDARARVDATLQPLSGAATALEALDTYVERWTTARDDVCSARDGHALDVAQAHCLSRARSRFSALVAVLGREGGTQAEAALRSVQALPDPEPCASQTLVAANLVPLPPLHLEEQVATARGELDRVRALVTAGSVSEALEALERVDETHGSLEDGPFQAERRFMQGKVWFAAGRYRESKSALEDAAMMGVSSHHRSVAAEAWARLVFMETNVFGDFGAAHRAARLARAELEALGSPSRTMSVLRAHEAGLAVQEERYDEALATYRELLDAPENQAPLMRADLLINLVNVQVERGSWDEAEAAAREYIEIYEDAFGPKHANLVLGYYNLGYVFYARDAFEEAIEPLLHSVALGEEVLPPNHPDRGGSQTALCRVYDALGRREDAVVACTAARAVLAAGGELSTDQLARVTLSLAEMKVKAGDTVGARTLLDEVDGAVRSFDPPMPDMEARALTVHALVARADGDLPTAQRQLERALEMFRKQDDATYIIAESQLDLARVVAERGDVVYATELLDDVAKSTRVDMTGLRKRAEAQRAGLGDIEQP